MPDELLEDLAGDILQPKMEPQKEPQHEEWNNECSRELLELWKRLTNDRLLETPEPGKVDKDLRSIGRRLRECYCDFWLHELVDQAVDADDDILAFAARLLEICCRDCEKDSSFVDEHELAVRWSKLQIGHYIQQVYVFLYGTDEGLHRHPKHPLRGKGLPPIKAKSDSQLARMLLEAGWGEKRGKKHVRKKTETEAGSGETVKAKRVKKSEGMSVERARKIVKAWKTADGCYRAPDDDTQREVLDLLRPQLLGYADGAQDT